MPLCLCLSLTAISVENNNTDNFGLDGSTNTKKQKLLYQLMDLPMLTRLMLDTLTILIF